MRETIEKRPCFPFLSLTLFPLFPLFSPSLFDLRTVRGPLLLLLSLSLSLVALLYKNSLYLSFLLRRVPDVEAPYLRVWGRRSAVVAARSLLQTRSARRRLEPRLHLGLLPLPRPLLLGADPGDVGDGPGGGPGGEVLFFLKEKGFCLLRGVSGSKVSFDDRKTPPPSFLQPASPASTTSQNKNTHAGAPSRELF